MVGLVWGVGGKKAKLKGRRIEGNGAHVDKNCRVAVGSRAVRGGLPGGAWGAAGLSGPPPGPAVPIAGASRSCCLLIRQKCPWALREGDVWCLLNVSRLSEPARSVPSLSETLPTSPER